MSSPSGTATSSDERTMGSPLGTVVLLAGLLVFALSVTVLIATGNTAVRYSADGQNTVEMWQRWIPALVGIAAVRLMPWRPRPAVVSTSQTPAARHETLILVALAVAFAIALTAAGGQEPAYTAGKITLLVLLPLVILRLRRRRGTAWQAAVSGSRRWRTAAPAIPLLAWALLAFASPLAAPASNDASTVTPLELIAVIVVGFLVNAVIEEVFYRRWLLSRAQAWLGPWPAIILASLLWSLWHIAIQGNGDLGIDLASVVVIHAPFGVFLGYLWSRYRAMWPILVAHGALNALPLFLTT